MTRPADDEVTSDVDPEWIAGIRAQVTDERRRVPTDDADDAPDGAAAVGDDWLDGEPPWDPEATVGASDGLIERIRGELRTPSQMPAPAAPPTPPTTAPVVQSTVSPPSTGHSTTMRWEPRQRLATTAPVQAPPTMPIGPQAPGLDRTKVAIATIVAIALVLTVWLLVRANGDGDAPDPIGSVPGSSIPGSTVPDSADSAASTVPTGQDGG